MARGFVFLGAYNGTRWYTYIVLSHSPRLSQTIRTTVDPWWKRVWMAKCGIMNSTDHPSDLHCRQTNAPPIWGSLVAVIHRHKKNKIYSWFTGWWCYFTILKNDGVRQWVPDDIPYMKWKIKHVPSHQPSRWTSQLDLPAIAQGFSSYGAAKGHAPVENLWCFCEAYGTNMALQSTCCKTPWNSMKLHRISSCCHIFPCLSCLKVI